MVKIRAPSGRRQDTRARGEGHQTADCTERGLSSPHGRGLPPQVAWTECGLSRSGAISRVVVLPPRLPPRLHARPDPKAPGEASREAAPTKLQVRSRAVWLASRKPSADPAPSGRSSTKLRLRSKGQFSQGEAKGGAPRPDLLAALLPGDLLSTRCSCWLSSAELVSSLSLIHI